MQYPFGTFFTIEGDEEQVKARYTEFRNSQLINSVGEFDSLESGILFIDDFAISMDDAIDLIEEQFTFTPTIAVAVMLYDDNKEIYVVGGQFPSDDDSDNE